MAHDVCTLHIMCFTSSDKQHNQTGGLLSHVHIQRLEIYIEP